MKTKILLIIVVSFITVVVYSNTNNYYIPTDSIRYAVANPGKPIIVSSSNITTNSLDYIWVTEYSSNLVMVYEDCKFSEPFNQTKKVFTHFNWTGLMLLIIGIVFSIISGRYKSVPSAIIPFVVFFIISHSNVYFWLKIMVLTIFVISFFCGYILSKLNKNKKLKSEKL